MVRRRTNLELHRYVGDTIVSKTIVGWSRWGGETVGESLRELTVLSLLIDVYIILSVHNVHLRHSM